MADVVMPKESYNAAALDALIERFKARHGSFTSQSYLDDERTYKFKASEHLHTLLTESRLRSLIEQDQFEAAKTEIKRACAGIFVVNQAGRRVKNNLLNQYDMRAILDTPAEPLARTLYDLLYGSGPLASRFAAWADLLINTRPLCWPATTYFLMLHDPQHMLFIKPEPYRALLTQIESDIAWDVHPAFAQYERLLRLGEQLLVALRPLGAQDMIDVHSFIWVVKADSAEEDSETAAGDDSEMIDSVAGLSGMASMFQSNPQYDDLAWPPDPVIGPAFVLLDSPQKTARLADGAYSFTNYTPGERPKLNAALQAFQQGGPPVHVIFYRPQPHYAFTAWARVLRVSESPGQAHADERRWTVQLEYHALPVALKLTEQTQTLLQTIPWLGRGLASAFTGYSIRQITSDEFHAIIRAARAAAGETEMPLFVPRALGPQLRPYIELAVHLDGPRYTAAQIVDRLGRIVPPIVQLRAAPDAATLADELVWLRLLEPLDDGTYRRWPHLADSTVEHMLRYAALTLLLPDGMGSYRLPVFDAPFDAQPHPIHNWPIGQDLLSWYEEAQLVRRNEDGTWQSLPGALEPLDADTSTAQALNTFLANLLYVRASPYDLPPLEDGPLAQLPPEVLKQRIAEIQRELLIDRSTILRIYRSLIAGHHVILSGPPGTGKTHLARRLPQVFWRDITETVLLRMPITPELPPTASPVEEIRQREGYHVEVVTATEDWGVRDVIGGIVPQLQRNGETRSLLYSVRHGCLTRTMLANYAGYDGALVPPTFYRNEIRSGDLRYRGRWLVIDEFTRAPIDAAFGSLLTVLGGQHTPTLAVPTDDGVDASIPLPRDFRVIGTLNSFDRHFLNQISEAMKRRFTFIDVLPPGREYAEAEQAMAIYRALVQLARQRMPDLTVDEIAGQANWNAILTVRRDDVAGELFTAVQYRFDPVGDVAQVLSSFWRIFTAIRVYRQLGTAQAEAVYTEVFAGKSIGMRWAEALDTALADVLADQLQVLARDEQRVLLAFIERADSAEQFAADVRKILEKMPGQRQMAHLSQLRAADPAPGDDPIDDMDVAKLRPAQLVRLFDLGAPLVIGQNGLFTRRLRAFVNERGL